MENCTIEVGLLRKKPCGHAAVAHCLNCEQPLCVQHAVAQLSAGGAKTGKSMCQECTDAEKRHARTMAGVAQKQEEKKMASLAAEARNAMTQGVSPTALKPKAPAAPAPAAPQAEAPDKKPSSEPSVLEFTPSKK
jgi:hypothetical protein